MTNFVRILGIILLLLTTVLMIIQFWVQLPVNFAYLFGLFMIGAISLMWANLKESREYQRRLEEVKKGRDNSIPKTPNLTEVKATKFKKRNSGITWSGTSVWGASGKRSKKKDFLGK